MPTSDRHLGLAVSESLDCLVGISETRVVAAQPMNGRYGVTKTYPQRGPLQQYRLDSSTSFVCFRCGASKTSKLVTVLRGEWGHLLCNGCYGRLLSLHEIRRDAADISGVADDVANELLALLSNDEVRRAEELLRAREARSAILDPKALRLLATAEYVAVQLANATGMDWSAAVIGLCKALEIEAVGRVVDPLAAACDNLDLAEDIADKDFGRVAKYCAGRAAKPPELGAIRHFLITAANSRERQASSRLLAGFRSVLRSWPRGDWLLDADGAPVALDVVTTKYRNPAAHTEELTELDYRECADFIVGEAGVLWGLVTATTPR